MNKYLKRSYFEKDINSVYRVGGYLRCSEEIRYQLLRDFDVEYPLFISDDVNMIFSIYNSYENVFPNTLEIWEQVYRFSKITDKENLFHKVDELIDKSMLVVVNTAFDKINMYKKNDKFYDLSKHKAMIIGRGSLGYYFLDNPYVIDYNKFIPHNLNEQIGIVKEEELRAAFSVKCEIGYIRIEPNIINSFDYKRDILSHMIENYFDKEVHYFHNIEYVIGKKALIQLMYAIKAKKNVKNLFTLPYICDVFWSRYYFLKYFVNKYIYNESMIKCIDEIMQSWKIIKNLIIRQICKENDVFYEKLLFRFQEIIRQNDKLFAMLDNWMR